MADSCQSFQCHRSTARTKTTLRFAYPPPAKHKQRLNIRPRLLLQLHQISNTSRPIPVLDVLPSVTFAPRFVTRFPRIFKGKDGLGPNDLLIVKSPKYDGVEKELDHYEEDQRGDARELVAAIRQMPHNAAQTDGQAEIVLNNGLSCEATVLRTGRYDFTFVGIDGSRTNARWVPRHTTRGEPQHLSTVEHSRIKYTFSLIDPHTRRHPVIATLSSQSIEIYDYYSTLQPQLSPKSPSPSGAIPDSPDIVAEDHFGEFEPGVIEVDENLRTFIAVTGIWVVFQEGCSPFYNVQKLSPPLTPGMKSLYTNESRATNSVATQSTSSSDHSDKRHSRSSGEHTSSAATGHGPAHPLQTPPMIRRAYSTEATSSGDLVQAPDDEKGAGSSSDGKPFCRGLCQYSRRGRRRNTVSLVEKSTCTNDVKPGRPLSNVPPHTGGEMLHLGSLPSGNQPNVIKPGRIKCLFGFRKQW